MKKFLTLFWLLFFCGNCASGKIYLTANWRYNRGDLKNFEQIKFDDSGWEKVSLPHTLRIEPARFKPGQKYYRGVGLYRLRFSAFSGDGAKYQPGDRVLLHFEGVLTRADVWLNGKYIGWHLGGYTPFTFDITDAFLPGEENLLAVKVDNSKMNVPPEGMLVDYTLFGGIYREVWLELKPPVYLQNPFAYTPELDEHKALLKISSETINTLSEPLSCKFSASLDDKIKGKKGIESITVAQLEKMVIVPAGNSKVNLEMEVINPKLWSPEYPYLYDLSVRLDCDIPEEKNETCSDAKTRAIRDSISFNYGFRFFKFTNQGFFLNGKRVQLIGQNRHQSYPYIGNAAGFRLQYLDALLLKESGANFVRLSHYPQSPDFLDACDHLGLMVFEELPGWGFVGNNEWKAHAEQALREMIVRDRNRPSVILWGVRINEAWWGEKWLEKMIQPAHELDPTRPASGARFVRNFRHIKEDVIAHNDYSGRLIKPPIKKPWIVSEYVVGATSLEKITSSDAQQIAIIRNNAYMLDLILSEPSCSGSTGWAFADYNTFITRLAAPDAKGRIRRHGMVDIFRLKKPVYYFYQAQTTKEPMVKIINQWWQKDDFPGEVLVVGNCEQVRLILNGKEIGTHSPEKNYTYPLSGEYQSLPHPPFSFSGFRFEPGELIAQCLIQGAIKAEDHLHTPGPPAKIQLEFGEEFNWIAPFYLISSDLYSDPVRVIARIVDAQGNPVKDNKTKIQFSVSETGEIIGDNPFQLQDGIAVIFVRLKVSEQMQERFGKELKKLELSVKAQILGNQQIPASEKTILIAQAAETEESAKTLEQKLIQEIDAVNKPLEELFGSPELILRKLFKEKIGAIEEFYPQIPLIVSPEGLKEKDSGSAQ